jgi:hypothetical protein
VLQYQAGEGSGHRHGGDENAEQPEGIEMHRDNPNNTAEITEPFGEGRTFIRVYVSLEEATRGVIPI